jgi:hypothetical protein
MPCILRGEKTTPGIHATPKARYLLSPAEHPPAVNRTS